MLSEGDRLFGRVAIVSGILNREKLRLCIKKREKVAPNKPLGLFLLEDGHISHADYEEINNIRMDMESRAKGVSYEEREAVARKIDALMDKALEEFQEETRLYEHGIVAQEGKFAAEPDARGTTRELLPHAGALDDDIAVLEHDKREEALAERYVEAITQMPSGVEYLPGDYGHLAQCPLVDYLASAKHLGASDFHFSVGSPPFVRLDGRLVFMQHPVVTSDMGREKILGLLNAQQRAQFLNRRDMDFTYDVPDSGRFRTNIHMQRRGISASFRIIHSGIRTLEELGLPPELRTLTEYSNGIVLVTGPAGCGKSTTLAAFIDIINRERREHVVMIEEPIEFVHDSLGCNISQREVRRHTSSFHVALRASLREDPDVIVVGELRDLETISMAVTSAETGHLVFGTLHTTNATRTVDRILDVFPAREQEQIRAMVSESLRGAVSQQLLPRADGRGRVPAVEVLFNTPAVANLIRDHKTYQLRSVIQTSRKMGMRLMDDSIRELLERGLVARETAQYYAEDSSRFNSGPGQ